MWETVEDILVHANDHQRAVEFVVMLLRLFEDFQVKLDILKNCKFEFQDI